MRDMSPLDKWLNVETWHTFHPKDEERFYKAVFVLMVHNTPHPEPEHVRDYILEKQAGRFAEDYLHHAADRYVDKYDAVYSFVYENKITF